MTAIAKVIDAKCFVNGEERWYANPGEVIELAETTQNIGDTADYLFMQVHEYWSGSEVTPFTVSLTPIPIGGTYTEHWYGVVMPNKVWELKFYGGHRLPDGGYRTDETVKRTISLPTSTLEGVTTDENGQPLEGATVTLNGYTVLTDSAGYYIIDGIELANYTISISKAGYKLHSEIVDLSIAGTYTKNIQLETEPSPDQGNLISLLAIGGLIAIGVIVYYVT